jgi:AraC family transcriptional regulator
MIIRQFPDLNWLKAQIDNRFANKLAPGNLQLDSDGFPSVIINTKSTSSYRPDIVGPVSLFTNISGCSYVTVDRVERKVNAEHFFISNRFQSYSLAIESNDPVETFNIHIGEYFSEQVIASVLIPDDTLLNHGKQLSVPTIAFFNRLHKKDAFIQQKIDQLKALQKNNFSKILFEETLASLLLYMLSKHRGAIKMMQQIPSVKTSTRKELYKRVLLATDVIHSTNTYDVSLDELATAACLSKFHFVRLFKQVHQRSPYQYLQQLKTERATSLLKKTKLGLQDIAMEIGLENASSLSRFIHQQKGVYPQQIRN